MSAYSFTKLFSSITKSTVWCEPHTTLRVWITMLADCDSQGRVQASIPGLANLARVSVLECEAAIETFLAPDPYSRTPDNEGRRIETIDGGWRLLNYAIYREMRDPENRKEQNREAQRRSRARQNVSADLLTDGDQPGKSAQAEAEAEAEGDKSKNKEQMRSHGSRLPKDWAPSATELKASIQRRPDLVVEEELEKFRDFWTAKAGRDATKLDWAATWRNWIRNARPTYPAKAGHEPLTARAARLNQGHDKQEGRRHERDPAS